MDPKVDTALNFWREKKQRLQAWQTLQDRQIAAATLAENRQDQKKWMSLPSAHQ